MNKKIIRPIVLTLTLLCVMLFAFKSGYVAAPFGYTNQKELPEGVTRTPDGDKNRLGALSAEYITHLRTQFFNLNSKKARWDSLPKSSNDSLWINGQQRRLHSVLSDTQFDTIVLPIQQSVISYDKTARMMAARFVADDIRKHTQNSVMPVEFVYQLLGGNRSQFSYKDVATLQSRYKVKKIVYLFLREDYLDKNKLFLVASLASAIEDKIQETHYLHIDKPSDEKSLSSIVSEETPKLTEALYGLSNKIELEKSEVEGDFTFPDSLESFTNKRSAIETALHLQLLGMTISEEQRLQERTRYFERSLLALRYVSHNVPELKILKARALFYLFRRPEAVKILSSPESTEEKAFLSFMNGNFYDLEKHYKKLKPNIFQAISYIELKQLADSYSIPNNEYSMAEHGASWAVLLNQAANDNDGWASYDNYYFFDSLKGLYPNFDTAYAKDLTGKITKDHINSEYSSGNLLFESTITTLLKSEKLEKCCHDNGAEITDVDILEYYRSLGLANLLRELNKKIILQGVNTSTTELFEESSSILDGDIKFTYFKARSLASEIKRSPESNHPRLLKSLIENTKKIYRTSNSEVLHFWSSIVFNGHSAKYKKYFDFDDNDRREVNKDFGDWPSNIRTFHFGGRVIDSHHYEYNHDSIFSIKKAYERAKKAKNEDEKAFLLEELERRYDGHPDKVVYLSDILEKKGDKGDAISILEKAVRNGDKAWGIYSTLAGKYVIKGRFKEAAKTYLMYPGFAENSAVNRVHLSNYAYDAGSLLYWKGEYELAKPLYEIAANLQTGSVASISSAQRLAYIAGDYARGAHYARSGATRYSNYYRYRDFISLMHMFEFNDDADAMFAEITPRSKKPDIWTSLLVGHRKKSTSLEELMSELSKYSEVNDSQLALIKRYITMFLRTDSHVNKGKIDEVLNLLKPDTISGGRINTIKNTSVARYLDPQLVKILKANKIPGVVTKPTENECRSNENTLCVVINHKNQSGINAFMGAHYNLQNMDEVFNFLQPDVISEGGIKNIKHTSVDRHLNPLLFKALKDNKFLGVAINPDNGCRSNRSENENSICVVINYEQLPSKYELFLRAYYDLENKNYKSALEKFIQYDIYYPIIEYGSLFRISSYESVTLTSEILVYVAIAASKMGKSQQINKYLKEVYDENEVKTFDYWLAKAIIASEEDQISESIEYLKNAFLLIPYTESRSIDTWYQLVEASEWLFNETGDQQFIEMALNWMQDYQVIDPVHAWSYAFEAKYSKNEYRKLRATGIADYLDPNSQWLSEVPNELKLRARKWMKNNNPFVIKKQLERGEGI